MVRYMHAACRPLDYKEGALKSEGEEGDSAPAKTQRGTHADEVSPSIWGPHQERKRERKKKIRLASTS